MRGLALVVSAAYGGQIPPHAHNFFRSLPPPLQAICCTRFLTLRIPIHSFPIGHVKTPRGTPGSMTFL